MYEVSDEVNRVAREIYEAALAVHAELGPGFAESVYEEALCFELHARSVSFERQLAVSIQYRGHEVGVQRLDLVVATAVVVELKSVDYFTAVHFAQLLGYLKATKLPLGLLINFNVTNFRTGIRRIISTR